MMNPEQTKAIRTAFLAAKTEEDLNVLFELYKERAKMVRAKASAKAADVLTVGMTVTLRMSKTAPTVKGTIKELRGLKAVVNIPITGTARRSGDYRVPLSMLTPANAKKSSK